MSRTAKLICITNDNHNKYYNMVASASSIEVTFGRVGASERHETYPTSKWDSILKAKLKKGYKDVTHLFTEAATGNVGFADISEFAVKQLINKLEAYAKKQVDTYYNVSANSVTKRQVEEAQSILNELINYTGCVNNNLANKYLLDLYSTIPRKMKKVQDHLLNNDTCKDLEKMLESEQDLLDTMSQQVKQNELSKDNNNDRISILDAMGLEIFKTMPKEINLIKEKLGDVASQYENSYRVVNKKTQIRFDKWIKNAKVDRTKLFFHGSRNENWMGILDTGLLLRPTGVVITGKMFGNGTYYADKARKSIGYTSLSGSYWAKGSANEAFMALFDVHLGDSLRVKRHESWMSSLDEKKLKAKGVYDSLFAEGGADLKNNEYIVYREEQSTIKYLIQVKGK
jgi:poly [ADP-ribose] polymerase 2/3/4